MAVMNGLGATFNIKTINNSVPIIAQSANVLNNEKNNR